ncbi:MAG TPA: hypothetical protein ENJ82_09225 [Bacteroidetes bacterium]|nr:hypothetical protein [Bacteroidota bacterium]
MKIREWFNKWNFTSLKINTHFLELELDFTDTDKEAAWEMYVELLTRTTTQKLDDETGVEKTALTSIFSLFPTTRSILKANGSSCVQFTKIAIIILNQVIRPFTAKWHKKSMENAFDDPLECAAFRHDLRDLQVELGNYTGMLSEIAGVEDLTYLEGHAT